jgi:hypothetical protein
MSWVVAAWPALIALVFSLIPGAVVAYALGFRRISLLGLAPIFSLTVLGLTAIAINPIHLRWGIVPVLLATVVFGLLAWVVRRVFNRWIHVSSEPQDRGLVRWALAGFGIAAVAATARVADIIGNPNHISQTYDNVFHLNTVRYIMDTGNADSLKIAGFPPSGLETPAFYPAGWHDLTSLVAQTSGASIPVAVTAVTLVTAAVLWPLSLVYLVRTIFGARRLILVTAGVVASGMAAFPFLTMVWGVLYPFMLSLAVLPALWALCIQALGLARDNSQNFWGSLVAIAIAVPGISLAHPSATMAVIVLCGPLMLTVIIRTHIRMRAAATPWPRFVAMYVGAIAAIVAVGYLFRKIQPGNVWEAHKSWLQAFIELFLNAPAESGVALSTIILVIVAIVVLVIRRQSLWLPLSWMLFAALFIIGTASPNQRVRVAFIGLWYGDVNRVAALLAIVAAPLAVWGAVWLIDVLRQRVHYFSSANAAIPVAASAIVLLFAVLQLTNLNGITALGKADYEFNAESKLLTPDEAALLGEVDSYVAPEQKVIGNPWTGTPLVFAYANRVPILSRPGVNDAPVSAVSQRLQFAATDVSVCASVREHNIRFVLDFGDREVHGGDHEYAGLRNLSSNPSVELVTSVGHASLWRITACAG